MKSIEAGTTNSFSFALDTWNDYIIFVMIYHAMICHLPEFGDNIIYFKT